MSKPQIVSKIRTNIYHVRQDGPGRSFSYYNVVVDWEKRMVLIVVSSRTAWWYDMPNGMTVQNMWDERYIPSVFERHRKLLKKERLMPNEDKMQELDEAILSVVNEDEWKTSSNIRSGITKLLPSQEDEDGDLIDPFNTDMIIFRCGVLVERGQLLHEIVYNYSDETLNVFKKG